MAFVVIMLPDFGRGFAAARLDAKATIDTLYLTVGLEHHFDLLNALGMGMEIRVAENRAKTDWIGSEALS